MTNLEYYVIETASGRYQTFLENYKGNRPYFDVVVKLIKEKFYIDEDFDVGAIVIAYEAKYDGDTSEKHHICILGALALQQAGFETEANEIRDLFMREHGVDITNFEDLTKDI